ncbi:MAG: TrkH family potassium uptake protein [Oscillospiraceae bacterium]|nr:TrkH family potassium uptake protein [Oscillospiraceae bacterium]
MKRKFSQTRIIALGYILIIIVGTLLLMLPAASQSGKSAGFVPAMFTAVSASCVTGLVVLDTATSWTVFGQAIIITLIQIGGLGFMTIATMFSMLLKRRMGLREREIMVESINTQHIGGIMLLTRKIIAGTVLFETCGALLLATRFIPRFGPVKGIWYSVFHSVSAFCNAGFDLMGITEPYASLTGFSDDVVVNFTLCALIIIGGIGFLVWDDIGKKKLRFKYYQLHTKLVLTVTAILLVVPSILFFVFERDFTNAGLGLGHSVLNSVFDSVTARTAGFNTTDTAALSPASKILTIFLMFIGGSPGSTAGGIKTTTLAVIAVSTFNGITRRQSKGVFGRRLEKDAIHKASSVAFTNMSLAIFGIIAICAFQPTLDIGDIIFECVSAIGTVGMSTGITRSLTLAPRLIIAFLMFCGRVGSVSFALALMEKRAAPPIKNPREKITIG